MDKKFWEGSESGEKWEIACGRSEELLRSLPDNSIDSVVTDPPYGLGKAPDAIKMLEGWMESGSYSHKGSKGFMNLEWDSFVPQPSLWKEVYRVLKPGGHVVAFAGTRTQDLMALGLRIAGFEIRDMVAWIYGGGWPKTPSIGDSIDKGSGINKERQLEFTAWMRSTGITAETIDKATSSSMSSHYLTDKQQPAIPTADKFDLLRPFLPEVPENIERLVAERTGIQWSDYAKREIVGKKEGATGFFKKEKVIRDVTEPFSEEARKWKGWHQALKPAIEPITLARKPMIGNAAQNVLAYGTGGIKIDGTRTPFVGEDIVKARHEEGRKDKSVGHLYGKSDSYTTKPSPLGRYPTNILLSYDEDEFVIDEGREKSEEALAWMSESGKTAPLSEEEFFTVPEDIRSAFVKADNESKREVYRIFPCKGEFGGGKDSDSEARFFYSGKACKSDKNEGLPEGVRNEHATVKPTSVMRWLCKLITPPGGVVLDPFCGSGTTGKAAIKEGFCFLGVDLGAENAKVSSLRVKHAEESEKGLSQGVLPLREKQEDVCL